MMLFKERAELAEEVIQWMEENNVAKTPLSVISYLEAKGRLRGDDERWIPTKIAKPPKAGQYLVTKQQKTGVCQIATAYYNPSFDEWSGNGNFTKVLAWQQLPTPYTQE